MREILFRGKRIDNGEWVYGYYVPVCFGKFPCVASIVPEPDGVWEPIKVIPESVTQYTGLKDNNGKKIFEGDVVAVPKSSYVKSPQYLFNDTINGVIEFGRNNQPCYEKENNLGYYIKWFSDNETVRNMLRKDIMFWFSEHFNEIKVIGNIHNNPELLEVGK